MRRPRLFVPGPLASGAIVDLPEQAARHVIQVLRLRLGADLILFDGAGGEYHGTLRSVDRRGAAVELGERIARELESPLTIVLGQGISRGERMDYAIQKAVELGAHRIAPLTTERTVVNLDAERRERRFSHWQGVVQSACEQCGRNRLPVLDTPQPLAAWLDSCGEGLKLVLDASGSEGLRGLPRPSGPVFLVIGPEGGLSGAEIAQAQQAGFTSVRLGPRILRTETAGVAVLAALQVMWGDAG